MSNPPPAVLVFAASDPTGGAGVQADLLTLARLGCHPLSVVTGLTAQDTRGVHALWPVDAGRVARQAECVLADIPVAAFKLGVLGTADVIAAVADILAAHPTVPVVLDPVLASGRGDALAERGALEAMRERLLPHATVLTPNSLEARRLADAAEDASLAACAARLVAAGCAHVLVTGTHEASEDVVNSLYSAEGLLREDRWPRLPGEYHGSGCTLASAIAAELALGCSVANAVQRAQSFTWKALDAGFRPGGGQHLPQRFFTES